MKPDTHELEIASDIPRLAGILALTRIQARPTILWTDRDRLGMIWLDRQSPHWFFSEAPDVSTWADAVRALNSKHRDRHEWFRLVYDLLIAAGMPVVDFITSNWNMRANTRRFYRTERARDLDKASGESWDGDRAERTAQLEYVPREGVCGDEAQPVKQF